MRIPWVYRTSEEIIVLCHPRNVENLVQSFEDEITHAAGALPLYVLWSGVSGVLHQGVIVLASDGAIPAAFLQSLACDHEVFDFVVYDWTVSEDSEEEQDQTSQKIAEPGGGELAPGPDE